MLQFDDYFAFLISELEEIKDENGRLKSEVKRLKNMAFAEEVVEVKNDKCQEQLAKVQCVNLRLRAGKNRDIGD